LTVDEKSISIKLVGSIDRVEVENGIVRLIDYKTGKVEQRDLRIDNLSDVLEDSDFAKSNQLLYYSLLYIRISKFEKIE
jgi:ATP-dependent helicase/nuclease subunit B